MWRPPINVIESPELHNRSTVFADRKDAGNELADLLGDYRGSDALVAAIPAGGVPIGAVVSKTLQLAFDVLVVSKMTLPWNTEAGYGAMSSDGTVRVNQALVGTIGLDADAVDGGIEITRKKVAKRELQYHELITPKSFKNKTVIIVDDGIASGFTLQVAIESARNRNAKEVIVAVPTGHSASIERIAKECDKLYCVNIREGFRFAVADAYKHWTDVSEDEVRNLLLQAR